VIKVTRPKVTALEHDGQWPALKIEMFQRVKNGTAPPQIGQLGFEKVSSAGFNIDLATTLRIAIVELSKDRFNAFRDQTSQVS
jgi:hypothetical protein